MQHGRIIIEVGGRVCEIPAAFTQTKRGRHVLVQDFALCKALMGSDNPSRVLNNFIIRYPEFKAVDTLEKAMSGGPLNALTYYDFMKSRQAIQRMALTNAGAEFFIQRCEAVDAHKQEVLTQLKAAQARWETGHIAPPPAKRSRTAEPPPQTQRAKGAGMDQQVAVNNFLSAVANAASDDATEIFIKTSDFYELFQGFTDLKVSMSVLGRCMNMILKGTNHKQESNYGGWGYCFTRSNLIERLVLLGGYNPEPKLPEGVLQKAQSNKKEKSHKWSAWSEEHREA